MANLINCVDVSGNTTLANKYIYNMYCLSSGNNALIWFTDEYKQYIPDYFIHLINKISIDCIPDSHFTAEIINEIGLCYLDNIKRTRFTLMSKNNVLLLLIHNPIISIEVNKDIDLSSKSDIDYIDDILKDKIEKYNLLS